MLLKQYPFDLYSRSPELFGATPDHCLHKSHTLARYKYTFMAENHCEPGYFTEKLWDAI